MTGTPRWAMSPLDFRVHLLASLGDDHSSSALRALWAPAADERHPT